MILFKVRGAEAQGAGELFLLLLEMPPPPHFDRTAQLQRGRPRLKPQTSNRSGLPTILVRLKKHSGV
jgi:hypothetical protein